MIPISITISLPFLAALTMIIFSKRLEKYRSIGWFLLPIPILLFISLLTIVPSIANGKTYQQIWQWIPTFDIHFMTNIDGLSMVFGLLITGIGSLVIFYSIFYLATEHAVVRFYIYLFFFMGSMLGVVFSDHLMTLYLFWELTSISSFLLIAFWYQRRGSRDGAKKALLITVFGGLAMFIAFLMLHQISGTYSVREIIASIDTIKDHPLMPAIIVFLLLGAFTKSAQFPFHIWLPGAMEAPTPVSAYLHSATMVKAGIYIVARFTPVFAGEMLWFWLVSLTGLITLFWAALTAIRQVDLKALLAYSTVSQLGLIMTLFGVGSLSLHPDISIESTLYTQAIVAALFHLVNHSTFKGALFMVIGIIDFRIGTRDLRRLSGLIAFMPLSFTIAVIGSFSMAGLPPFNGFLSKEMFFTAMLHIKDFDIFSVQSITVIFPVIAWVASLFTFIYCMLLVFETFFGPKMERERGTFEEASFGMLIAPGILALLVVLLFFFPNVLHQYILQPAVFSIYPQVDPSQMTMISHWHGWNTEIWMTIAIVLIGLIIYRYKAIFMKIFALFPYSLSFNQLYTNMLRWVDSGSKALTQFYMTRFLRQYLAYIFIFFSAILLSYMYYLNAFSFTTVGDEPMTPLVWIITITIVIAGMTMIVVPSRLAIILINGYIGFSIALLFVIFRAPDLALTQLVVETITTTLFLLCFYFLPKWSREKIRLDWMRFIIAISVGLTFTLVALSVKSGRLFESISNYFEQADELAGGTNIVNTILGDFRAFDTMLEVIVLFIAGIGVYTLIKYKTMKRVESDENK